MRPFRRSAGRRNRPIRTLASRGAWARRGLLLPMVLGALLAGAGAAQAFVSLSRTLDTSPRTGTTTSTGTTTTSTGTTTTSTGTTTTSTGTTTTSAGTTTTSTGTTTTSTGTTTSPTTTSTTSTTTTTTPTTTTSTTTPTPVSPIPTTGPTETTTKPVVSHVPGLYWSLQLLPQSRSEMLRNGIAVRILNTQPTAGITALSISHALARRAHIKRGGGEAVVIGVGTMPDMAVGVLNLKLRLAKAIADKLAHAGRVTLTVSMELYAAGGEHSVIHVAGTY